MSDLIPCPFCGGEAVELIGDGRSFQIGCDGCGAKGAEFPADEDKAIVAWNTRATPERESERDLLVLNLAMLVFRLAHRLNLREDGKAIAAQAMDFQRHNLQGSPLGDDVGQGRRG